MTSEHSPTLDVAPPDRAAMIAANVNPDTGLATDYLNHFNEAIMLIGLVPDMPDVIDDLAGWAPKSYARHFQESRFQGRDVAVAAYAHAPAGTRRRFLALISDLDTTMLDAVARLEGLDRADPHVGVEAEAALALLHPLVERASAIINGTDTGAALDIDEADPNAAQAAIDALFDAA